ncbi:MAG TPA: hypothetical protein VM925_21215 [Labilithrix sp.]|jgi:hypothetical protein|nr:hypothetical protein [Labilithrix sp.]
MKTLILTIAGGALTLTGMLAACAPPGLKEDLGGSAEQMVESNDPLEGAYVKSGGTPLRFIFKRGESTDDDDTFLGEIEVDGKSVRREGTIILGRDNLGTTMSLKPDAAKKSSTTKRDGGVADAGARDGGAPQEDTRALDEQAFSGTVHYLKIGKNSTLLVRGDANGKTAHYEKVKSWCSVDEDCSPDVQNTRLECATPSCSSNGACVCGDK